MALSRADALAAVERSPEAVGAHDRDGWVGLFTFDARVEDPVGSQPHRGHSALSRFYDTFIAPRDITFHRDVDIVVGPTVIRDLELELGMAGGVTMRIPAYLRYDVENAGEELKIAALYAFWELPVVVGKFLRAGVRAVPAGLQLSKAMLTNQGVLGTVGFLSGFRGAGPQGKRQFRAFLGDARAGDEVAVRRRLAKGARVTVGDETPLSTAELLARFAGARPHKLIASGHQIVVGLDREGGRDVLIAEVTVKPFAITRIRYFSDRG